MFRSINALMDRVTRCGIAPRQNAVVAGCHLDTGKRWLDLPT
jgi:hypothetical protein